MSSEQSELKDTPAHVEQIASYTTQDEKDQTLFHRKGSNEEFVDEKAAAHGGYDAHEESKDEKVLGLRKKLFKMLVHGFLWVCFTGMFLFFQEGKVFHAIYAFTLPSDGSRVGNTILDGTGERQQQP